MMPMAATGPGCGGTSPCTTESPAASGNPSRSSGVFVSRARVKTMGTSSTSPTAKNTGMPTMNAMNITAQ